MARPKKDAKNFACKFDREIYERLEEYCQLSGQSKTTVVERAVQKYLEENLEKMREFSKQL
jgi:predicted DNA-binding protein